MLIIATQWSCAVDEGVKQADKAVAATSDFVIEPNMNYFINGALTYDYDAVKVAAKDAWNTHYDYSKNKVVISTNPTEFEKYKKNDIEFARRFEEGNEGNESNDKSTNSARIAATYVPNHDDNLVFYYLSDYGTGFYFFNFHVYPVNDTSLGISNVLIGLHNQTNYVIGSLNLENMFSTCTTTSSDYVVHLKNNNHLSAKTLTLYRYKNQSTAAATRSFTVAKNEGLRMYAYNFRFSDGVYAKSYK
ncbi:hypothetical protein [Flavobacterium sp.]|uniref:hypothetical protein n=1 Tax=Flavobacterium sp. TaxID=239 RepID=UPI00374D9CA3